ncbi:MAG: glutamine--scyllo-inositol aminotransferase [Nitrospina sp.]|nr:glutamine--scyllo-inositol aminotransferase [Nitrospina sp.]
MVKKIKLFDPVIDTSEKKAILQILKSGFWASGAGVGNVLKFENKFKKYIKSDECVAVNSGTAALNLALSLFDIKNKEVILPSLSFVSTAHCIIENKGIPVFVDVEPETLCIDPKKIISAVTKKTRIILPVHFGGMPCNLNEIQKIAKKYNLDIVEDAAHSAGSMYHNNKIGTHGQAVCFSFHPVKNLGMPTGGLISINSSKYKKFKKLLMERRWCGITNRKGSNYDVKEMGWNYYMNEFSAAIGIEQLKKLDNSNSIRKRIGKKFNEKINVEIKMPYNEDCSYHLYWILVKNREKFREKLSENGIETGTHYKPIHLMSMYKKNQRLPITEKVGKQIVTLPIHPNLSKKDIDKIIRLVNKFI